MLPADEHGDEVKTTWALTLCRHYRIRIVIHAMSEGGALALRHIYDMTKTCCRPQTALNHVVEPWIMMVAHCRLLSLNDSRRRVYGQFGRSSDSDIDVR